MKNSKVLYQNIQVKVMGMEDRRIFYREAGEPDAPVVLLLHGYPTSSHMYRNLIPVLSEHYHVLAPDLIGFGFSDSPHYKEFNYTFANLTKYIQAFIDQLDIKRFAMQVFDYGAPVGFRLALAHPEMITGIITQNGNAYDEGLSPNWDPIRQYWANPSLENRNKIRMTSAAMTELQYFTGVKNRSLIAPESYTLNEYFLERNENQEAQLDLFKDYASNVALYPAFQQYFQNSQVPLLAVWGDKDPFFLPAGAIAFKKDLPNAIVEFFDTGHFALETHIEEIGESILTFLKTLPR